MLKTVSTVALVVFVSSSGLWASEGAGEVPVLASFAEDTTGDVARIGAAKTLRTFSQKIPTIACFLYNGIDVSENRERLEAAGYTFERKLSALRDGDDDLGIIGGETRRKTLARLDQVDELWSEMEGAVTKLIAAPEDASALALVKGRNIEFFEVTDLLVTEVSGQYANPSILDKGQALRLNIVSRTSAMTQKIAKNICMSVTYPDAPEFKERLQDAAGIYAASLTALRHGMPEMGIQAAPTPEIEVELDRLVESWGALKPDVDAVLQGEILSGDAKADFFTKIVVDMGAIEELMFAYKEYAKYDY